MTRHRIGEPIWNEDDQCYVQVYYDTDKEYYEVVQLAPVAKPTTVLNWSRDRAFTFSTRLSKMGMKDIV